MNLQLAGLQAVVTGGSSGIGAAIVRTLAAEGCKVAFCARDPGRIDTLLRSVGIAARCGDGTRPWTSRRPPRFQAWLASLGHFDIFVANVSALSADWTAALHTDIRATVDTTEAALPVPAALAAWGAHLHRLQGRRTGGPQFGCIRRNQGGHGPLHEVAGLAAAARRAREHGLARATRCAKAGCGTACGIQEPGTYEKVLQRNPMQRLATPEEIARVVAFVSSPAASFVAGANWYVDGASVNHVQF